MNKYKKGFAHIVFIAIGVVVLMGAVGTTVALVNRNSEQKKVTPVVQNNTKNEMRGWKTYKDEFIEFQYPLNYSARATSLAPEYRDIRVSNNFFTITISNTPTGFSGWTTYVPNNYKGVPEIDRKVTYLRSENNYMIIGGKEGVPFYVISSVSLEETENLELREIFYNLTQSLKNV